MDPIDLGIFAVPDTLRVLTSTLASLKYRVVLTVQDGIVHATAVQTSDEIEKAISVAVTL